MYIYLPNISVGLWATMTSTQQKATYLSFIACPAGTAQPHFKQNFGFDGESTAGTSSPTRTC